MESMNNICKNVSALVRPRSRDSSTIVRESDELTTRKTAETYDVPDAFSTISTSTYHTDTYSTHQEDLRTGFATTTTDKFLNRTITTNADTDLYIADDGANVTATSSVNSTVAFAKQSTLKPANFSEGTMKSLL